MGPTEYRPKMNRREIEPWVRPLSVSPHEAFRQFKGPLKMRLKTHWDRVAAGTHTRT